MARVASAPAYYPPPPHRVPLSFDFDGTLTDSRGYRWPVKGLDLTPVTEALARGYAVHVLTVNDTYRVAGTLRAAGIDAVSDDGRNPWMVEWDGGHDGTKVLVTNRKLKARAYIDDRGLYWRHGMPTEVIWNELDRRYPPQRAPRKRLAWLRRVLASLNPRQPITPLWG